MITVTTSPTERLAAIIAAGVARYQESLPDFARDVAPVSALPYYARPLCELPAPEPIITLSEERQARICLNCPLADCVDITDVRCPIRIEQRAAWRKQRRPNR